MIEGDENGRRKIQLRAWLAKRLAPDANDWLDAACRKTASGGSDDVVLAIALAPRKLGKGLLALDATEGAEGTALRAGLDTSAWTIDQAARILLMLEAYRRDDAAFAVLFDAAVRGGDLNEQIALLQGLPLYPASERLVPRAIEGLRTAMLPVFEAVAHRSPYPAEQFSEQQWNQMVLKALFIESRLAPIVGLDDRRNADLAATLVDYAHERWAAGRDVSPELWRCVGPFARERDLPDLAKALASARPAEARAAALALAECPLPAAAHVLQSAPPLAELVRSNSITWNALLSADP